MASKFASSPNPSLYEDMPRRSLPNPALPIPPRSVTQRTWRARSATVGTSPAFGQIPMTPPSSAIARISASRRCRSCSRSAKAPVWLNTTGAVESASVSRIVSGFACARSSTIPSRLHSRTTSRPNSVSPPGVYGQVWMCPSPFGRKCTSCSSASPIPWSSRSRSRSPSSESAPSTAGRIASAPSARARRASAGVRTKTAFASATVRVSRSNRSSV